MRQKKRTVQSKSLFGRLAVACSLGISLAWYSWVVSENKMESVKMPSPVTSRVQSITIDESRKNPLLRQRYLDQICDGTPYKAVYDPSRTEYARRYKLLDVQDGESSLVRSTENRACVVVSKSFQYGKREYPPIYVFPGFWENGFDISGKSFTTQGKVEALDVIAGKSAYYIGNEDDAKSVIVRHEGWHSQDVHDGIGLSLGEIKSLKRKCRKGFDSYIELRAYMNQLKNGRMNLFLWSLSYRWAMELAKTCAEIKMNDDRYQKIINSAGTHALMELPSYSPGRASKHP